MKVEICSEDILLRKVDDEGRIEIGKEFANRKIVIALLEVKEE